MSLIVDEETIAESLLIPLDLVKGILTGEVNDDALKEFDTAKNKETVVVEKRILTRGKVIMTIQHAPLAAAMGLCLAETNTVAVIDLEPYPTIPLYLGIAIKELPKYVNLLWDDNLDKKKYKENLYIYQSAGELNMPGINEVLKIFQTVVINCSEENWSELAPYADVIYITQPQNQVGIHKLFQIFARAKTYEEKSQVVWIKGQYSLDETQCLKMLRGFSDIMVAGEIPEMFLKVAPQEYSQTVMKILLPVFPELKPERKSLLGRLKEMVI
ncbi:hypothetical protein [Syntrophomonas palmitatica]|uniref:hypothetical protein n=1 Tax=Syntrophomonas palmitatica TaxID=402877 RepID=UPI0006CFE692|nr:hypothetical protein [Syntrophomonas palmitatica]